MSKLEQNFNEYEIAIIRLQSIINNYEAVEVGEEDCVGFNFDESWIIDPFLSPNFQDVDPVECYGRENIRGYLHQTLQLLKEMEKS